MQCTHRIASKSTLFQCWHRSWAPLPSWVALCRTVTERRRRFKELDCLSAYWICWLFRKEFLHFSCRDLLTANLWTQRTDWTPFTEVPSNSLRWTSSIMTQYFALQTQELMCVSTPWLSFSLPFYSLLPGFQTSFQPPISWIAFPYRFCSSNARWRLHFAQLPSYMLTCSVRSVTSQLLRRFLVCWLEILAVSYDLLKSLAFSCTLMHSLTV